MKCDELNSSYPKHFFFSNREMHTSSHRQHQNRTYRSWSTFTHTKCIRIGHIGNETTKKETKPSRSSTKVVAATGVWTKAYKYISTTHPIQLFISFFVHISFISISEPLVPNVFLIRISARIISNRQICVIYETTSETV